MPDSSVQICAYWTPGDKYAYEAREEKFKIDDQGDTTLVYRQSERRVFEILSQTKDRYKIRLTYGDYMTTDKEDQLVHDAIVSATGPCVVEFETDETGSLLGIANLETLVAQAEASVEPAVRVMWETIPSAERKNFPKKNFRKYMARTLSDPSVVINAVNDDLGRMFFFPCRSQALLFTARAPIMVVICVLYFDESCRPGGWMNDQEIYRLLQTPPQTFLF
mgnify:CR=1 FL=1